MKRILVADNDESLLKAFAALLNQAGYDVLAAADAEAAERALRDSHIHLAILDVRLNDDSDKLDKSGLILAKEDAYSRIPKIILTNFPDYVIVRQSLADAVDGRPAAVDFLAKEQDADVWVETVHQAFEKHVKVNWNLRVSTAQSAPGFTQICEFVSPGIKGEAISEKSAELEEIFLRLFYDDEEIRIDKLLWKSGDKVALVVFSFSKQSLPQGFVVICGPRKALHEEVSRFSKYRPKDSGPGQTILERATETVHFGGICYTLAGASLEDLQPLREIYVTNEKSFQAALKTLFGKTLNSWHEGSKLVERERTLDDLYREDLGLGRTKSDQERFKAKVESLASRLPMIGTRFAFNDRGVTLNINGRVVSYPDPLATMYGTFDFPTPVPVIITPGAISADTIFASSSNGPWLTNFAMAGPAPLTWNHVAVEAAVRFDLVRSADFRWAYQMEQALVEGDFSRLYAEDMEGSLKKAVRTIQLIRKDAAGSIGGEVAAYHLGIFFQAASRLIAYNPDAPMRDKELAPFAHLLLAMCIIGGHLRNKRTQTSVPVRSANPIEIDKENRRVLVEGVPLTLKGKGYQLLCFLYDRAGRLCERKELIEAVFDEPYDAADESQQSKLNTAIHRLREKIEDDAEDPQYLLTAPGGYRLVIEGRKIGA